MISEELGGLLRETAATRDRVLAANMEEHRGHARELSLAATKLDEARAWLLLYGERTGEVLLVIKEEYRQKLAASATVRTVETQAEEGASV